MSQQPFEPSSAQQAVVQITLGQVYNEVRQTHEAVQGLVNSLEPIKDKVSDHEVRLRKVDGLPDDVAELKKTVVEGHGPRLAKLENRAAMYAGGAAVLGAAAGSLVTHLLSR